MPKIARTPLTKARIGAAEHKARQTGKLVRLWDANVPGLGVRIQPTGSVSWFLYFAKDDGGGASAWRTYTIRGTEGATIDEIRTRAEHLKADLLRGVDPLDTRKAEREAARMDTEYPRWLRELDAKADRRELKASTVKEYRRQWDPDSARKRKAPEGRTDTPSIKQALGGMKVKDVTPQDVRSLCASVSGSGEKARPVLANRLRARLHTFFAWCEKEGLRPRGSNPVTLDVERNKERTKERFLSRDQISALSAALDEAESTGLPVAPELKEKKRGESKARPSRAAEMRERRAKKLGVPLESLPTRPYALAERPKRGPKPRGADAPTKANPAAVAALRFLLWSGWREQEVLSLRWDALDEERSAANLADTKGGASWRPLAPFLVDFLKALPRAEGATYVFPGRKPGKPLKEIRHLWYAVRHRAGLAGVRLHDLRHTNASVMLSAGASLAVVGATLGHKDAKSTQRYAKIHNDVASAAQQRAIDDMRAWATGTQTPVTPIRKNG